MTEDDRIARLREVFSAAAAGNASDVGIGDDAAVLAVRGKLVVTVDTQVEDVHFRRAWLSMRELGARSFIAAASDLAAMGATPRAALSSLILPAEISDDDLNEITLGQAEAAKEIGAPIIGGNLARGPLSITTTVLGEVETPLLRSGAKQGDLVIATGPLGCAAAGLTLLQKNMHLTHDCVKTWKRPRARIDAGRALIDHGSSACIDVSDGFALDLHRLCEASSVGARIDEAAIKALGGDALMDAARLLAVPAIDLALFGGEDYALVAALNPKSNVPTEFIIVGTFTERAKSDACVLVANDGSEKPLPPRGFQHF